MLSEMGFRVWGAAVVVAGVCTACAGASAAEHHTAVLRDAPPPAAQAHTPAVWHVPARPSGRGTYLMAKLRRPLHTPFGRVAAKTQFGEPLWVPVIARHGTRSTALVPVGARSRLVHLDLRSLPLRWSRTRVVVDLAQGRLRVLRGRRLLGSFPIGHGTSATPTPVGRFSVTDRVRFPAGSPYAPFALALSAHQTHLAATWAGGDTIAIHPGPMGPVSNGCIHAGLPAIALLRRVARLGTLVIVRAA
jgi:hypothetical protein